MDIYSTFQGFSTVIISLNYLAGRDIYACIRYLPHSTAHVDCKQVPYFQLTLKVFHRSFYWQFWRQKAAGRVEFRPETWQRLRN